MFFFLLIILNIKSPLPCEYKVSFLVVFFFCLRINVFSYVVVVFLCCIFSKNIFFFILLFSLPSLKCKVFFLIFIFGEFFWIEWILINLQIIKKTLSYSLVALCVLWRGFFLNLIEIVYRNFFLTKIFRFKFFRSVFFLIILIFKHTKPRAKKHHFDFWK